MTIKEYVSDAIEGMGEAELHEVADYLAFLKFRSRAHAAPRPDRATMAALYAESGAEDRALAEEGMADYVHGLQAEDVE